MLSLYKIKESKYKDPNEVYKVPIQSDFLHHLIVTSTFVNTSYCIEINQEVKTNSAKYVESMEPCDEEKEVGKVRRTVLILHEIGSVYYSFNPLPIYKFSYSCSGLCSNNKVRPFPG